MYQIVEMEDTVRIPPNELGEDQDAVARELVHRSFEGRLNKKHGCVPRQIQCGDHASSVCAVARAIALL